VIAAAVLLVLALPTVLCQTHAECSLMLQGYMSYGSSNSSSSSGAKLGVAAASLSCNSSDGSPVFVAFDSTYLQQHVAAFMGVSVLSMAACQEEAPSIRALLYFCSSGHYLTFTQPLVQNLRLPLVSTGSSSSSSGGGWYQAVIAFGSSIDARIVDGRFLDNVADTMLAASQQAVLNIVSSTFVRNNATLGGKQAFVCMHDEPRSAECAHRSGHPVFWLE
jgi:hypothetical protein